MTEEATDWLDIEPQRSAARDLMRADPRFQALTEHTKKLTAMQRNFIGCYAAAHYDPIVACRAYKEKFGRDLSPKKLERWMRDDPVFLKAIAMREDLAARAAGVSAANTLSLLKEIARRNFEGKPVLDEDGQPTGETRTDDRAAMESLKLLGTHLRLWKEPDQAVRVTVQLIEFAGAPRAEGDVIDVTPPDVRE